jgi:hypothetical protein
MTEHENRDRNGRWLKGTTGNAGDRAMTNRQRISELLGGGPSQGLGNAWGVNSGAFRAKCEGRSAGGARRRQDVAGGQIAQPSNSKVKHDEA